MTVSFTFPLIYPYIQFHWLVFGQLYHDSVSKRVYHSMSLIFAVGPGLIRLMLAILSSVGMCVLSITTDHLVETRVPGIVQLLFNSIKAVMVRSVYALALRKSKSA